MIEFTIGIVLLAACALAVQKALDYRQALAALQDEYENLTLQYESERAACEFVTADAAESRSIIDNLRIGLDLQMERARKAEADADELRTDLTQTTERSRKNGAMVTNYQEQLRKLNQQLADQAAAAQATICQRDRLIANLDKAAGEDSAKIEALERTNKALMSSVRCLQAETGTKGALVHTFRKGHYVTTMVLN